MEPPRGGRMGGGFGEPRFDPINPFGAGDPLGIGGVPGRGGFGRGGRGAGRGNFGDEFGPPGFNDNMFM